MQNLSIDPKTGDYILSKGTPVETDSLTIPAYIRLKVKRTQWLYAPDTDYGSDLYTIKKRRTTEDASFIENIAAGALQPIANDGRASSIEVTTVQVARHGIGLQADIADARGVVERIVLPAIG